LQVEHATEISMGDEAHADVTREKALLEEMHSIADGARGLPDARVRCLIEWIRKNMCPGACVPGGGHSLSMLGSKSSHTKRIRVGDRIFHLDICRF
jgi:hypothetical protein